MGRELEKKFRADDQVIAAIEEKYGEFTPISMETTYYDTMDMKLAMHHWTLRRRMENGVSVCTFKTPLADGSRGEWEVECGNILTGVLKLYEAGAPAELVRCTAGGLIPTCGAKFTRLAKLLEYPDFTAELALDRGVLIGRGKEQPFAEVEVEYKAGSEEAALAFAAALAEEFCLESEPKSKFLRAMTLAMGV